jgi:lysophospholipase L1-like esterase
MRPGSGQPTTTGAHGSEEAAVRWRRYVAVGDSFTEGLDDPHEDGSGLRGWADLVATHLATQHRASERRAAPAVQFRYANLAVRGRLFDAIVERQVPEALRMRPDLISLAGGGNDVLRRRFDPAPLLVRFDRAVATMRASGADVIVFRWANITDRLPGGRMILPRMLALNAAVSDLAHRHGATLVDLWHDDEFGNPRLWSDDRLHMGAAGHRRVAAHVLTSLGVRPEESWFATPGRPERPSWVAARVRDARWARRHLAPWVTRRLTGRSSGDSLSAKRPALTPIID